MPDHAERVALEIRCYQAADRDAVWSLHRVAVEQVKADAGDDFFEDLRNIERAFLRRGEFLVGLVGERVMAMGGFVPINPGQAEIKGMRVHSDYQRRGFGRALLEALESRAVKQGFSSLYLETTVQQAAARRLYQSDGYRETGRKRVRSFVVIRYERGLAPGADRRSIAADPAER